MLNITRRVINADDQRVDPERFSPMAQVEGSDGWLREAPMRVLRIYGGVWALAIDAFVETVRDPGAAIERVELRGVRVQRSLRKRLHALEGGGAELGRLTDTATAPMRWVQREMTATGVSSSEEMERQVERMLEYLGLPSRERIDKLTREIESLSKRIDDELAAIARAEQEAKV